MQMEEIVGNLNEYQREAVLDESPACLVKANVGSGKTTVLVAKILYLHYQKGIPYEKMVVLTFTNKAADEIKERLYGLERDLQPESLNGFGTFHSVALWLLQNRLPIENIGYQKEFTVIDPEEELEIAQMIIGQHSLKIKYPNRLKKRLEQEYKLWKQGRAESRYKDELFHLFELLRQEKVRQNKMSFSDLLEISTALLQEAKADGSLTEEPDWVIVDEVQDSDRQQLEMLTALKGAHTQLFAVGDSNQVIYSWRGSEESIFFLLSHRFSARELTLPVNYRCSANILKAAGKFQQGGAALVASKEGGEKIVVRNHYDPFAEAEYLVQKMRELAGRGIAWREIAVFYRLQNQAELLHKVFEREGIPCRVSVRKTVADIPVLMWFCKVLRYSCNQLDDFIGQAAVNDKVYGGSPFLESRMTAFREWALEQQKKAVLPSPEQIYDYFELDTALHLSAASYRNDRAQILEFCRKIVDYVCQEKLDFLTGLTQFINSSALYGTQLLHAEEQKEADCVQMMTLHASKGLEFRCVFIIGVNEGLIPLPGKSQEEQEEERRLFYVGITRAKDYLELSWYTCPGIPRVSGQESRYLEWIPAHLLERTDRKEEAKADLTTLRRAVQEKKREREEEAAESSAEGESVSGNVGTDKVEPGTEQERNLRRVRHARYGIGTVQAEDDAKITVYFEQYGEKEFLKAFTKLEEVRKG